MLKTISGLQGVTILSKKAQKKIGGGKNCGFKTSSGVWVEVVNPTGGGTMGIAQNLASGNAHYYEQYANGFEVDLGTPTGNWCCDSCPW
jgi:hypothetical protein